jgi:hypothetical protein
MDVRMLGYAHDDLAAFLGRSIAIVSQMYRPGFFGASRALRISLPW